MRFIKPLRWTAAVVLGATATIVGLSQPASAAPVIFYTGPIYNVLTTAVLTHRVMAVLNASTGDTAPMIQHSYTAAGPNNDRMIVEAETTANVFRIKPQHTYSNDGNVHNDKCLAVKNNTDGNNIPIVSANCTYDSVNNDVWILVRGGTGIYFQNQSTGECITTQNASTANNARLITFTCNTGLNGWWAWE